MVFEDLYIPKGRPLWPAIWLLPTTNPVYGGRGTPKGKPCKLQTSQLNSGGDWATWPSNGEVDIMEAVGADPRIFGTLHYTCGNENGGWPGLHVTVNE